MCAEITHLIPFNLTKQTNK